MVWIVAFATAFQSILEAADSALGGSAQGFALWLTGAAVIAGLAAWVEKVKATRGE